MKFVSNWQDLPSLLLLYLLFHPDCPLKGIDLLVSMAESRY